MRVTQEHDQEKTPHKIFHPRYLARILFSSSPSFNRKKLHIMYLYVPALAAGDQLTYSLSFFAFFRKSFHI